MIIKWLGSVIRRTSAEALQQGGIEESRRRQVSEEKVVDLPHRVLTEDARERHAELAGLVKTGWPLVKREKMKREVRRKVWQIVSDSFHTSDEDMVEEITERIVEAAEVDSTYEQMIQSKRA